MDTTQYTLDLDGARRYFADLSDMLEVYKDMEGFALSTKGKSIGDLELGDKFEVAVKMAVCVKFSETALQYLEGCVDLVNELLDSIESKMI